MVTFDLGRVTTSLQTLPTVGVLIVVTFDLGRVTTPKTFPADRRSNCGDVRSRTSYNTILIKYSKQTINCGDVRSRTSYNKESINAIISSSNCGDVRSRTSYNGL